MERVKRSAGESMNYSGENSPALRSDCCRNHQSGRSPVANRVSKEIRVVIMGAAGRDFHNFNVVFRAEIGRAHV